MKRKKTRKHEDSPKTLSNINNSSKSLQRKCRENESEDNQNKKKNPLNIYDSSQCLSSCMAQVLKHFFTLIY